MSAPSMASTIRGLRGEGAARRREFRSRVFAMADAAGARCIAEHRLQNAGKHELLVFATRRGCLFVVLSDDGVDHYTQGGAEWADLERDLCAEVPA